MGFLQLGNIDAHQKAVIAFWVRVPAASWAAAAAMAPDDTVPFARKLPLLCWGKRKNEIGYDLGSVDVMNWNSPPTAAVLMEQSWSNPHVVGDFGPSYIAIGFVLGSPCVLVHIQTDTTPTIVGRSYSATSADGWGVDDIDNPFVDDPESYAEGSGYLDGGTWTGICNGLTDTSFVLAASPASFDLTSATISFDHWHQIIVSYDLSDGVSTHQVAYPNGPPVETASQTTASARAWFAIDDVNIKMTDASGLLTGGGDNDIITSEAHTIALQSHATRTYRNLFTATATYDLTDPVVGAGTVGVPGSSNYVPNIRQIQTAELQFFTGVTADTSLVDTRRLFLKADGTPQTITDAATALGREPIIQMHGSKKWKTGQNTGSGGNLAPSGEINPYANPSLS